MPARSGNRELMRDLNRHLVLNLIKNRGPISRTEVAAQSGLSQATVTHITRDLLADGLIQEVASGPSTGGRRPVLLEIDPAGGYALGLKLTPQAIILALTDLYGDVVRCHVAPAADPQDVPGYLDRLESAIVDFLREAAVATEKLIGIGVGLPGFIDHETGICHHSPLLGWHEVPLRQLLENRLFNSVVLDNDVNTLTLYESLFGNGRGISDFVVVTIGRGVGMGAYVNSSLLRGGRGGAGEFGHIPVLPDGPLCNCGRRGCLEALASDPALVAQAQRIGLNVQMPEDLLALAQAGDAAAIDLYRKTGDWLGRGLATLVNIFNPTHLILSGEGVRASQFWLEPMQQALRAQVFDSLADDMHLIVEPLEDYSWARGAASLVLNELFSSPI